MKTSELVQLFTKAAVSCGETKTTYANSVADPTEVNRTTWKVFMNYGFGPEDRNRSEPPDPQMLEVTIWSCYGDEIHIRNLDKKDANGQATDMATAYHDNGWHWFRFDGDKLIERSVQTTGAYEERFEAMLKRILLEGDWKGDDPRTEECFHPLKIQE